METILITGGCGYIGSHTCLKLLESNYNLLLIDSLVNSSKNSLVKIKQILNFKKIDIENKIEFIEGDLRDKLLLDSIFEKYITSKRPITKVIHFAGLKSIFYSINDPLEYWDSNVKSTLSLLTIMKKHKCKFIIFSSSATVYKHNGTYLFKETDILEPTSPYGKTKLCIEQILRDLFQSDKSWKIANLRYFNPVGAHSSGLLEENSKCKSSNLFPSILKTIKGEQKKLFVYGKDWPTPDGTCVRDFIHIMDLADAHIATLDYLNNSGSQNISINIGTGKGISVFEVIKTFQSLKGISFDYDFVERRLGDESFLVADNRLALKLLNWSPQRSLYDMCNDSICKNLF